MSANPRTVARATLWASQRVARKHKWAVLAASAGMQVWSDTLPNDHQGRAVSDMVHVLAAYMVLTLK